MPDSNQARQDKVKLEDLLRLKRKERPNTAFWNSFDRELHQRMLQALVKKDPWYAQVVRGLTGRLARGCAMGTATALIAVLAIRPALIEESKPGNARFVNKVGTISEALEVLQSNGVGPRFPEFDLAAVMDYRIEAFSGSVDDGSYTAEYALDSFEVAGYDREAYVSDSASSALSGVATGLVY